MSVQVLGELSLSAAVPLLAAFNASLQVAVGFSIPELQAKLAGLGQILVALTVAPPDLTGTINAAIATVATLQASISGPTVTLEAAAIVALIASLNVQLELLTAAAELSIPSANLSAYVYEGPTGQLGAEVQAVINSDLPGAPAQTYALILVTTSAAAWASAGLVFKLS